jgi:hypothetical protein
MKLIKTPNLLGNRRGVSAVISNMILVAAVITIGFAAVAWTYSQSSAYMSQYGDSVNSDVAKLRERVSFEYIFYNSSNNPKTLTVYLMNSGKVGDINFTTVYISYTNTTLVGNYTGPQLKFLNGSPTRDLDVGQEGYFTLSVDLKPGNAYTVKMITRRGSSFGNTFVL